MKIKLITGLFMAIFAFVMSAFAQPKPSQIINQSVRGRIGAGTNVFTLGFVVVPAPGISFATASNLSMRVLIRGVGPKLAALRVQNPATDPSLVVYNSAGSIVAQNDNWSSELSLTASQVGAFPLDIGSRDAALLVDLRTGAYTVQVNDPGSLGSEVLAEVYDVSRNTGLIRLGNLSVRTGNLPITAGFVTDGVGQKRILARAIGPSLSQFGLTSVLANPKVTVYNAQGVVIASNDDWGSDSSNAGYFTSSGAFPLLPGSRDAAVSFLISPNGPLSISVVEQDATSNNATSGLVGLVEIYEVP